MLYDFDYIKCIESKETLGKSPEISLIWKNQFSASNVIGNCTNLYRKLKPTSYLDFYEKYIKYGELHKNERIRDRGLLYNELISLAERYKKLSEEKIDETYDLSVYFYDTICHIIVETFDGQEYEREYIKYLKNNGCECLGVEGGIDAKYGVDILTMLSNGKIVAFQIKPFSFIASDREDVQNDRIELCKKYEMLKSEYGIPTYYGIYKKDKDKIRWTSNKGKYYFKINELFRYDPKDIEGSFIRVEIERNFKKLNR